MNYSDKQTHLDIVKWHESENNGMDMCRHMPYCDYCQWGEEFPCAKAYERMEKAEAKKAEKKPAAKKAAPKAAAAKEEAPKAPAKKPAAKKKA